MYARLRTFALVGCAVAIGGYFRQRLGTVGQGDIPGSKDHLDYAEAQGAETLAVLRQAYDDLYERAYKFSTVLVGGGGAAAIYALGRATSLEGTVLGWAPVAAVALSWFGIAGQLIWNAGVSRELSPGVGPGVLLAYYDVERTKGTAVRALETTRRAKLGLQQLNVLAYQRGCIERALAIDLAYKTAAICTPAVPAVTFLLGYLFGGFGYS
ncbi:hypothetical protein [Pseudacidovorax intermedius]|uniref:hypothetical protein n=1 Tax=Pseudacidovorax intermedius TaxID=433924 RepID=UPI0026EE73EC|nr:hypothetical protein [Pseudacidovorax intermedius]